MARSAKQAKRPAAQGRRTPARRKGRLATGAAAIGALISQNPTVMGGSTAVLVALFYVSANALWYQPHIHRGAFFPTRDFVRTPDERIAAPEPETTFLIERPVDPVQTAPADPVVKQVQDVLSQLGFYGGKVDGLSGPATSKAIENYRRKVGLTAGASIDDDLLVQLGVEPTTSAIAPTPTPRVAAATDEIEDRLALTKKVQAGLKAFGNDAIEVDGVLGEKTRNAIREFQSIFRLPVSGEPDKATYLKMREAKLTD